MIENDISILGYSKEQICDRFLLLVNIVSKKNNHKRGPFALGVRGKLSELTSQGLGEWLCSVQFLFVQITAMFCRKLGLYPHIGAQ